MAQTVNNAKRGSVVDVGRGGQSPLPMAGSRTSSQAQAQSHAHADTFAAAMSQPRLRAVISLLWQVALSPGGGTGRDERRGSVDVAAMGSVAGVMTLDQYRLMHVNLQVALGGTVVAAGDYEVAVDAADVDWVTDTMGGGPGAVLTLPAFTGMWMSLAARWLPPVAPGNAAATGSRLAATADMLEAVYARLVLTPGSPGSRARWRWVGGDGQVSASTRRACGLGTFAGFRSLWRCIVLRDVAGRSERAATCVGK